MVKKDTLDKLADNKHIDNSEFAQLFMDMVNSGGSRASDFSEVVCSEHRFLQSEAYNLFVFCIEGWAKAWDEKRYDGRNEHVCKNSHIMLEALKEAGRW